MINIQRILVAIDFSDSGNAALQQAKELAEIFHAQLEVLHVVEEPFGYVASSHGYIPELDAFLESLNSAARAQLNEVLTPAEVEHFQARLSLKSGTPYAEIVRFAKDHNADLIVMGTHGRGPLRQMFLGSVAEKVVRYASCSVLTVRHPAPEPDPETKA